MYLDLRGKAETEINLEMAAGQGKFYEQNDHRPGSGWIIFSINSIFLIIVASIVLSCSKEQKIVVPEYDTLVLKSPKEFLFNIPVVKDTILMDNDYGIDFRVSVAGYRIKKTMIKIDNNINAECDDSIINTGSLGKFEGIHQIQFQIKAYKPKSNDTIFFKSTNLFFKVVNNLSSQFVKISSKNGYLSLSWPGLDKSNTRHYLIERLTGYNKYIQESVSLDTTFIDHYYVGEEVDYKISVVNNIFCKQSIWFIHKNKEEPVINRSQNSESGFTIKFNRCKYYNNFRQYRLFGGRYPGDLLLFSSLDINDTIYNVPDAQFGDRAGLFLECVPKELPFGVPVEDKEVYRHPLGFIYGIESYNYTWIDIIDENFLAFAQNGNIYKLDAHSDNIIDSIANSLRSYNYLRTTVGGTYLFAPVSNNYDPQIDIWESRNFTTEPKYNCSTDYMVPWVSDNLIAVMGTKTSSTSSKVALYDVTTQKFLFTTSFECSEPSIISSDGQYLFIPSSGLKLCRVADNNLEIIWQENELAKYYRLYCFSPTNPELCYLWDDNKVFMINRVADFFNEKSFLLDVESIINIDFWFGQIMGFKDGKILIYSLADGSLKKEIYANHYELFENSNKTILLGNTIYNNQGVKYLINY